MSISSFDPNQAGPSHLYANANETSVDSNTNKAQLSLEILPNEVIQTILNFSGFKEVLSASYVSKKISPNALSKIEAAYLIDMKRKTFEEIKKQFGHSIAGPSNEVKGLIQIAMSCIDDQGFCLQVLELAKSRIIRVSDQSMKPYHYFDILEIELKLSDVEAEKTFEHLKLNPYLKDRALYLFVKKYAQMNPKIAMRYLSEINTPEWINLSKMEILKALVIIDFKKAKEFLNECGDFYSLAQLIIARQEFEMKCTDDANKTLKSVKDHVFKINDPKEQSHVWIKTIELELEWGSVKEAQETLVKLQNSIQKIQNEFTRGLNLIKLLSLNLRVNSKETYTKKRLKQEAHTIKELKKLLKSRSLPSASADQIRYEKSVVLERKKIKRKIQSPYWRGLENLRYLNSDPSLSRKKRDELLTHTQSLIGQLKIVDEIQDISLRYLKVRAKFDFLGTIKIAEKIENLTTRYIAFGNLISMRSSKSG